ncbi:MAG: hypothetical protein JXD22_12870, partial [Sedimentisphaerales bacterium]|nr:hypothetical protein [Sedimentisphaerales bacterium]
MKKRVVFVVAIAVVLSVVADLWAEGPGEIVGWGSEIYGHFNELPTGNDFVRTSAGFAHGLALKTDGSIVGWGDNDVGEIDIPSGNDFVDIAAGWYHSLGLKSDGSIVAWGSEIYGHFNELPTG